MKRTLSRVIQKTLEFSTLLISLQICLLEANARDKGFTLTIDVYNENMNSTEPLVVSQVVLMCPVVQCHVEDLVDDLCEYKFPIEWCHKRAKNVPVIMSDNWVRIQFGQLERLKKPITAYELPSILMEYSYNANEFEWDAEVCHIEFVQSNYWKGKICPR